MKDSVGLLARAAAAALLVSGLAAGCAGDDKRAVEPTGSSAGWFRLPDPPLSPRDGPVVAWTGSELVVVGGGTENPCPASASCVEGVGDEMARDGVAYDPDSESWRPIADAPRPIPYWARSTAVGRTLVVQIDQRWLAYDAAADSWRRLPAPPEKVVDDGVLDVGASPTVVSPAGRVWVLDVDAGTWSALPDDPIRPSLVTPTVVATEAGDVFVSGADPTAADDGDTPQFAIVDRWDGKRWTRSPLTGQVDAFDHWTGDRLMNLDPQTAPGLTGNPPYGGFLDPATGAWSELGAPRTDPEGWRPVAAAGPLVAGWGWAYDDRDASWQELGRPDSPVDGQQGAGWMAEQLVAAGGVDDDEPFEPETNSQLSNEVWVWRAP